MVRHHCIVYRNLYLPNSSAKITTQFVFRCLAHALDGNAEIVIDFRIQAIMSITDSAVLMIFQSFTVIKLCFFATSYFRMLGCLILYYIQTKPTLTGCEQLI